MTTKKIIPLDVFIRRLRVLPCLPGRTTEKKKLAFLAELVELGYEPQNTNAYRDSILTRYDSTVKILRSLKGDVGEHSHLFQNFPTSIPDDNEYFVRRVVGCVSNWFGLFSPGSGPELENGMVVPEWLFNLEDFGADPITQFQTEELHKKAVANQKKLQGDSHHVLHPIKFISAQDAEALGQKYLMDIFYAKSSIKESMKSDIEKLLKYFNPGFLDSNKIVFKETKSYLMKFYWDRGSYSHALEFANTPTDILRMFAALTNTDISLATPIKFPKLSNAQRRAVLARLDGFHNLVDNLNTYRGLWLAVGKSLHVGRSLNRYPNCYLAFQQLRNQKVRSWNGKVEMAFAKKNTSGVFPLLSERPGEFARRLHRTLRTAKASETLREFGKVAECVPLKTLFTLKSYFNSINEMENRTVINKKGNIKILPNDLPKLSIYTINRLHFILTDAIQAQINQTKNSWENKNVWVDPALGSFVAPLSQRKASEALISAGRGTRIPFDNNNVIRFFLFWHQTEVRTDYDLSLMSFNEDMEFIGQVSYTNLRSDGIAHSGDLQSAPHGAAEFIDVTLNKVQEGVRYLAPVVYKFTGESFMDCQRCFVGWMSRDKVSSNYKTFDVKTVENAFALTKSGGFAMPFLFDVENKQIVFVDIYAGNNSFLYRNTHNSSDSVSTILKEVNNMSVTRPNLGDIARDHVVGRGATMVLSKEDADITIGVDGCTYNAREIESLLNEFL